MLLPLAESNRAGKTVSAFVQGKDECSVKRRRIEGAGGMRQMMVKTEDALVRDSVHAAQISATVQFEAKLACGFGLEICAVDWGKGREPDWKASLSNPGTNGTTCNRNDLHIAPADSRAGQAEASGCMRNAGARARTN